MEYNEINEFFRKENQKFIEYTKKFPNDYLYDNNKIINSNNTGKIYITSSNKSSNNNYEK